MENLGRVLTPVSPGFIRFKTLIVGLVMSLEPPCAMVGEKRHLGEMQPFQVKSVLFLLSGM